MVAHSLRVPCIMMVGKAQWQKHEGAGHVAPLVRKQEEVTSMAPFVFFYLYTPGPGSMELCGTH